MGTPAKPKPPIVVKPTPKRPTLKKPLTKPLTGGTTYTAASFGVMLPIDTEDNPGSLKVRFYDAAGNRIPEGVIQPVVQILPLAMKAAVQAILAVPANQGESMAQWLLRAATPYVQSLYGAKV